MLPPPLHLYCANCKVTTTALAVPEPSTLIMIHVYGHLSESICAVVLHKGNFEPYSYIGHNVIFSPVKKLPSAYQHVKNLLEKFNPFVSDSHM
jgi:hypothetical protein